MAGPAPLPPSSGDFRYTPFKVDTATLNGGPILPDNAERWGFIMSSNIRDFAWTITTDPEAATGLLYIAPNAGPFLLTYAQVGPLVGRAWYYGQNANVILSGYDIIYSPKG